MTAGGGGVAILRRNPVDGSLTQLPEASGCVVPAPRDGCAGARGARAAPHYQGVEDGFDSWELVLSPDGRNAYASMNPGEKEAALVVFSRDTDTGALMQLPGANGCMTPAPRDGCTVAAIVRRCCGDLRSSPDGRQLYWVTAQAIDILDRDPATGALRERSNRAGCVSRRGRGGCARADGSFLPLDLAFSANGRYAYVTGQEQCASADQGGECAHLGTLYVLKPQRATAALQPLAGRRGCFRSKATRRCGRARALRLPGVVTVSHDGRSVYVAGDDGVVAFRSELRGGRLRQPQGRAVAWGSVVAVAHTLGLMVGRPRPVSVPMDDTPTSAHTAA